MSSRKKRVKKDGSVLLGALPVFWDLEDSAHRKVFRMLGAQKDIKKQAAKLKKQFKVAKRGGGGTPPSRGPYPSFLRKVLTIDTQLTREAAVKEIDGLIQTALQNAKNRNIEEMERIHWVRVIGYLYQVQRSIMKDVDKSYVQQELEKLKKIVKDELEKGSGKA